MYLESIEHFDEANELYNQVLAKQPANQSVAKRQVGIDIKRVLFFNQ